MADALCGPSNALSSFQKHAQVDRSLQQDRQTPRASTQAHESFRTSPGPSTSADFEAFSRGATNFQPPALHHAATAPAGAQMQHGGGGASPSLLPAWANDFQQLNIHEARQSPIPAVRFRHEAPLQRPSGSAWHTEFMRQTATPPPNQQQQQLQTAATFGPGYLGHMSSPMMGGFGGLGAFRSQQQQQQQQQQQNVADGFDDAAFAAAFDNAAAIFEAPAKAAEVADKGKGKAREGEGASASPETQQEQFSLDHACVEPPEPFFADVDDEELAGRETWMFDGNNIREHDAAVLQGRADMDAGVADAAHASLAQDSTADREMADYSWKPGFLEHQRELAMQEQTQREMQAVLGEQRLRSGEELMLQQNALTEERVQDGMDQGMDEGMEDGYEQERMERHPLDEENEEEERQRMDPELEADELSRTAGMLLDNLKHEQGEKFANSTFMALMRQLRDREVKVEGDHFVEVSDAAAASTAPVPAPSNVDRNVEPRLSEPDLGSRSEFSEADWA